MSLLSLDDRILGCLLGGAIGDAIGAHFEGCEPMPSFDLPNHLRVTDDTQLTLATCEAILDFGRVDPQSIANNFLRWFRQRRLTGLGSATLKSLNELDVGGHWALVGASGERAAGNGAAMRIAPLAFVLDPDNDVERQTIRDVCWITHRNDEAYVGALTLVRLIRNVVAGMPLNCGTLLAVISTLPDTRVRDRLVAISEKPLSIKEYATKFGASGYVVDSVAGAILAAMNSADLRSTMGQIVCCGGDTDSIASMCGQILGAAQGASAIPCDIAQHIDDFATVREIASRFAALATSDSDGL